MPTREQEEEEEEEAVFFQESGLPVLGRILISAAQFDSGGKIRGSHGRRPGDGRQPDETVAESGVLFSLVTGVGKSRCAVPKLHGPLGDTRLPSSSEEREYSTDQYSIIGFKLATLDSTVNDRRYGTVFRFMCKWRFGGTSKGYHSTKAPVSTWSLRLILGL